MKNTEPLKGGVHRVSRHVCYRCGITWDAYGSDVASGVSRYCIDCASQFGRFSRGKDRKSTSRFGGKNETMVPLNEYLD